MTVKTDFERLFGRTFSDDDLADLALPPEALIGMVELLAAYDEAITGHEPAAFFSVLAATWGER